MYVFSKLYFRGKTRERSEITFLCVRKSSMKMCECDTANICSLKLSTFKQEVSKKQYFHSNHNAGDPEFQFWQNQQVKANTSYDLLCNSRCLSIHIHVILCHILGTWSRCQIITQDMNSFQWVTKPECSWPIPRHSSKRQPAAGRSTAYPSEMFIVEITVSLLFSEANP